jgi:hypothetical protein
VPKHPTKNSTIGQAHLDKLERRFNKNLADLEARVQLLESAPSNAQLQLDSLVRASQAAQGGLDVTFRLEGAKIYRPSAYLDLDPAKQLHLAGLNGKYYCNLTIPPGPHQIDWYVQGDPLSPYTATVSGKVEGSPKSQDEQIRPRGDDDDKIDFAVQA